MRFLQLWWGWAPLRPWSEPPLDTTRMVLGGGGSGVGGEEALIADCGYPGITKDTKHKTKQLKPMSEINVAVDSAARRDFLPLGL